MEKLFRILENGGRAAIVQADSETTDRIEASVQKRFENCLRLTMDDEIYPILRAGAKIMIERARWSNRFDGLVILDAGSITDERLLAVLELCRKLTTGKILICSERLKDAIDAAMKVGLVPGMWTFKEITPTTSVLVRDAARKLNVAFDRMTTLGLTAKLADRIASSPIFSLDALVAAAAVKGRITEESLKAQELEGGYAALCREFMNEKHSRPNSVKRRIGFTSDPDEEKQNRKECIEYVA